MQRGMIDGDGEEESMKLFLSVGIRIYEMIQHFIKKTSVVPHSVFILFLLCQA